MMSIGTASEVAEAYSRYSFGVDNRRAEVIEGCFTPAALLGPVGQPPTVGREAIAERLMRLADPEVVHHAFNIVVLERTSDDVVARADFTMAKHGVVFATGHYDDSLIKSSDLGWLFSRRAITYTWRASTH
jgi:SnoaL-like domain